MGFFPRKKKEEEDQESEGKEQKPRDPGGYLEQYHFGIFPDHWHSYNGDDLYGAEATEKFNQYASDPVQPKNSGWLRGKGFGR